MQIKKIKSKKQYLTTLERFEELFQAKPGTNESDEADVLALVIKDYEEQHYVIDAPDSIDAPSSLSTISLPLLSDS